MSSYLVADIGGTKTLVAHAQRVGASWQFSHRERYPSADYPDIDAVLAAWLQRYRQVVPDLRAAALAVAGPVSGSGGSTKALTTNLPWPPLQSRALSAQLGFPVALLNDFAAVGSSLDALTDEDLLTLQSAPRARQGLRLVLGAGTGLGTCLVGPGPVPMVYAGEGGHADFAPADSTQAALADWIRSRDGRCSREHVLSGSGIARIAEFFATEDADFAAGIRSALDADDPAAKIQQLAATGHKAALRVIEFFVRIYAGQAGDMALAALPWGGVYLAGGIAPRWRDYFLQPAFGAAFVHKQPMESLLAALPVDLIVHPEPGLLGAAVVAEQADAGHGDYLA